MCYYDNYRYKCADFKWGNFRQHCSSEYRTGETCGARLVYNTIDMPERCTMCEKIERKKRRLAKTSDDYRRWEHDPERQASKSKAWDEMVQLNEEIQKLVNEKAAKQIRALGSRR